MSRVVWTCGCSGCPRSLTTRSYWKVKLWHLWHDRVCK